MKKNSFSSAIKTTISIRAFFRLAGFESEKSLKWTVINWQLQIYTSDSIEKTFFNKTSKKASKVISRLENPIRKNSQINSRAVGMAVAQPLGFEIDFARNPFSGSAAWFFVIILKFIFTSIFEIEIHEKKFLVPKKISFSKADFYKAIDYNLNRLPSHTSNDG